MLDVDIRGFFDTIDHGWLRRFLEHRIADRRVLRLVLKWLRAGVLEDGRVATSTVDTPQGAVASPLLAQTFTRVSDTVEPKTGVCSWTPRELPAAMALPAARTPHRHTS